MGRETTRPRHTQCRHFFAQIVFVPQAFGALTASDPGVDQIGFSNTHAFDGRADCGNHSHRLMPQDQGQLDAAISQLTLDAATHVDKAVTNMHIGVAYTAIGQADQYFIWPRLGGLAKYELKRFAPFGYVITFHVRSGRPGGGLVDG